jgi:polysaccharide chain length determinant protein (PEP-CTERM system associated)
MLEGHKAIKREIRSAKFPSFQAVNLSEERIMQEKDEKFNIDHYIKLIFKHRWLIIIPFCLTMIVGIYLAITLPKMYQASTLILIEPQSVPSNFVQSIVTTDVLSRITTIKEEILSRTYLEKIIKKFDLFSGPKSENMYMENKVANLRSRIEVGVSRDRRRTSGPNTFSIAFEDANPETAMKIANGLATLFIDENLKIREAQALGTSDFLENEMDSMRQRLQDVEESLRAYRARYRGELPEQLDSNLRILDNLQQQLSEREERLSDEKNRLIEIENQIQARKDLLAMGDTTESDPVTLEQLKKQLENLETSYTDIHPDVIRLRTKIANLESKYKGEALNPKDMQGADTSETQSMYRTDNTLWEQTKQQTEIKIAIKDLEDDIVKLKRQINIYQQRIERTPKREEELLALNRDYDNIQKSYSSLLNRKLEAEIAVNMEKRQKGEQFRIIDPAIVPHEPVSPDMQKLFMVVIAAGLGLGCGLIFLLDFFDSSIKDPESFESNLGIAVLATVPKIYQKKDFRLKRLNQILTAFSLVLAACLFAGFAALVFKGVEPTMEIVRSYMVF